MFVHAFGPIVFAHKLGMRIVFEIESRRVRSSVVPLTRSFMLRTGSVRTVVDPWREKLFLISLGYQYNKNRRVVCHLRVKDTKKMFRYVV